MSTILHGSDCVSGWETIDVPDIVTGVASRRLEIGGHGSHAWNDDMFGVTVGRVNDQRTLGLLSRHLLYLSIRRPILSNHDSHFTIWNPAWAMTQGTMDEPFLDR